MGWRVGPWKEASTYGGFFIFTKIYFRFQNLQEYTPAAPLPGGRDLVAPLRGGRGFCAKNFAKIFARRSLGAGRPAAGRPALAARLQGDRLSHPYIRIGWSPHPLFASLKFQKPRKKREGGKRSPAGFSSRRLQVTKILLRFTNRLCCNYFC